MFGYCKYFNALSLHVSANVFSFVAIPCASLRETRVTPPAPERALPRMRHYMVSERIGGLELDATHLTPHELVHTPRLGIYELLLTAAELLRFAEFAVWQ